MVVLKNRLCRNTHEQEVHTRTMKMTFQNLLILGAIHPFSWEILRGHKKEEGNMKTGGGFTPSLPHPH